MSRNQGATEHTRTATHIEAIRLLRYHGISLRGVARSLGLNQGVVLNAMTPGKHRSTRFETVVIIRKKVEDMLAAAGWTGNPADLWAEYDDPILQEAA